jgi:hypothetical protein
MQIEFRAIVHGEYGPAEYVLKLAKREFNSKELRPEARGRFSPFLGITCRKHLRVCQSGTTRF